MNVLVTGANGLLGSHLVAELLAQGHRVTIAVRRDQNGKLNNLSYAISLKGFSITDIQIRYIDMDIYEDIRSIITPYIDTIIHCAAKVDMIGSDPEIVRTNFELTHFLCEACLEVSHNPRFIHISSIATISSSSDAENPATENNLFEGMSSASAYGRSKFLSEMEVRRAIALGLRASIVNPSVVLGTSAKSSAKGMEHIVRKGLNTHTQVYPSGGNGFVYVDDLAKAIIIIGQDDRCIGERYIINGENSSFRELITYMNAINGHSAPRIEIKKGWINFALRIAKIIGVKSMNSNLASVLSNQNYWGSNKFLNQIAPDFKFTTTQNAIERIHNHIKHN